MHHFESAARMFMLALLMLVPLSAPSYSQSRSADIYIEYVSGGFILGGAGGSGTLVYNGKRYPLSVGGISVGVTIGLAKARLAGQVYNLRRVSDIAGTYSATDAGYALVGGRKTARLTNSRGVVLVLRGREVGVEATLDVSGISISLR